MFNLNLATTAANAVNNLLVESTCTTPRTPEILNSLIAMTNPLDNYSFINNNNDNSNNNNNNNTKTTLLLSSSIPPTNMSSDSNSSSSSQLESPTTNPPSVQHTCSQLIKAGLKLSIEQKRKHQNDGEDLLDLDKCSNKRIKKNECSESEEDRNNKQEGIQKRTHYDNDCCFRLTPEDEERRRRRRERNKIAATKCRLKKREKTANLINESETLETQNIDLKSQLQELQNQKRTLIEMLTLHRPHCQHNIPQATRESIYRIPSIGPLIDNNHSTVPTTTTTSTTQPYNNTSPIVATKTTTTPGQQQQQNIEMNYNRIQQVVTTGVVANNMTYTRPTYTKPPPPPSIIVEDVNDYHTPHLTNLDNPINNYYNNQCHSYNSNQNYNTTGLDNGCMA